MAPGLPPPSPRLLRDPSAGRAGEGDGAWATPSSPANGVTFQRRRFAPRRGEIEEPGDSSTASAVRLGSARYGYTFRRALLSADLAGLAAAIAVADGALTLAGRGGFASGPLLILIGFVPVWLGLAHGVGLYHLPERKVDYTFADELGPGVRGYDRVAVALPDRDGSGSAGHNRAPGTGRPLGRRDRCDTGGPCNRSADRAVPGVVPPGCRADRRPRGNGSSAEPDSPAPGVGP